MGLHMKIVLLLASVLAAAGQIFFKFGADGRTALAEYINPWVTIGFVCYGAGALLWIHALSKVPLVQVYPFTALVFVMAIVAGVFLFGESTSVAYWVGIGFILTGLFLVSL